MSNAQMTVEQIKNELSGDRVNQAIMVATMEYVNACIEEGFTREKTTQILQSKEGLNAIAERAAKYI